MSVSDDQLREIVARFDAEARDVTPYTKEAQLARGPKRYSRKVASPKQWQAITADKCHRPCRICEFGGPRGAWRLGREALPSKFPLDAHHLIPLDYYGDDVADNIIGLCRDCHRGVTLREPAHCRLMLTRLSDAEYAYAVGKAGEAWAERIYGVEFER